MTTKLHVLSGGRLRMPRSFYYPDAPRGETFELPVSCALIRHKQGNVLFDTGCSPRAAEDTQAYWGQFSKVMSPIHAADDAVVRQLPKVGLGPDDIDVVVCSHLHTDHCGCNSAFARASVICTAAELEAAREGGGAYLAEDWDLGRPFDTFSGVRDVFGDGQLTLLEMPGHTPGMAIAHLVLGSGPVVLASDAIPVAEVLEKRYAPRGTWDAERSIAALAEIARLRDDGATVLFGHDDAQWRSLKTGAYAYE